MTSKELRQKFLDFFASKGHTVLPSAPLVPKEDPTILFNTAGMQPLIPYLLGQEHSGGTRLANCQKCFRTVDIEEIGDNRHGTFFEMLGFWSLGDYFKQEAISWSFEFMTKVLGLDPNRIFVTVYKGYTPGSSSHPLDRGTESVGADEEAVLMWQKEFEKVGIYADCGEEFDFKSQIANQRVSIEDEAVVLNLTRKIEIKNIIFDFGGVLFEGNKERTLKFIEQKMGKETLAKLNFEQIWTEASKKTLDFQKDNLEFWQHLIDILEAKFSAEEIYEYVNFAEVSQQVKTFIDSQKDKDLYYLTNTTELSFKNRMEKVGNLFVGGLTDLETKVSKPDVHIYTSLIEKYNLVPQRSIFIDDRLENIETAELLGFQTIWFKMGETDLAAELAKIEEKIEQDCQAIKDSFEKVGSENDGAIGTSEVATGLLPALRVPFTSFARNDTASLETTQNNEKLTTDDLQLTTKFIYRITKKSGKDNWWGLPYRGPCGPCSEMYYLLDTQPLDFETSLFPRMTLEEIEDFIDSQIVEFGNNVFMQYIGEKTEQEEPKDLEPLAKCNIDTGIGFERLLAVVNKVDSVYETDVAKPILEVVEKYRRK